MADNKLSLYELQQVIRDSLYISFPGFYWVTAEIAELKENFSGHCYIELIEKQADDKNIKAKVKAIIWGNRYRFLKSFFEDATGESLREGLRVLVKIKIEYHEVFGLSLVISDIDPVFTIGEMAMKRQLIIKKLESEGVFSMNREIELPALIQRIAVISSKNAAGFTDFINHIKDNRAGYVFHLTLFESAMQGAETENAVISALEKIAVNTDLFDAVVIIRGGGSISDLSWFDNYNIAYYITQFPLPVITGIGHDKDLSVTDMVANVSLKTPTAVADFLIERMILLEEALESMSSEIAEKSFEVLELFNKKVETAGLKLQPLAQIMVARLKEKLSVKVLEIVNTGKAFVIRSGLAPENQKSKLMSSVRVYQSIKNGSLEKLKTNLIRATNNTINNSKLKTEGLENSLAMLNPVNVLKRGYTISSVNGKIIKSISEVSVNDTLETRFPDGSAKSTVNYKNLTD